MRVFAEPLRRCQELQRRGKTREHGLNLAKSTEFVTGKNSASLLAGIDVRQQVFRKIMFFWAYLHPRIDKVEQHLQAL